MSTSAQPQMPLSFPGQTPQPLTAGMPDPKTIAAQKVAYEKMLEQQYTQGSAVLQAQASHQKDYLRSQAAQQKQQFIMQIDMECRQQEMALEQQRKEQLMALQQQATQQRSALEQQSMQLTMDYQQRATEEQVQKQQYEMERQQAEVQRQMAEEMTKFQMQHHGGFAAPSNATGMGMPQGGIFANLNLGVAPPAGVSLANVYAKQQASAQPSQAQSPAADDNGGAAEGEFAEPAAVQENAEFADPVPESNPDVEAVVQENVGAQPMTAPQPEEQ